MTERFPHQRRVYSPAQVAEYLGCQRGFVFQLIRTGELRSFKLGRLRRISADSIDAFLSRKVEEIEPDAG